MLVDEMQAILLFPFAVNFQLLVLLLDFQDKQCGLKYRERKHLGFS